MSQPCNVIEIKNVREFNDIVPLLRQQCRNDEVQAFIIGVYLRYNQEDKPDTIVLELKTTATETYVLHLNQLCAAKTNNDTKFILPRHLQDILTNPSWIKVGINLHHHLQQVKKQYFIAGNIEGIFEMKDHSPEVCTVIMKTYLTSHNLLSLKTNEASSNTDQDSGLSSIVVDDTSPELQPRQPTIVNIMALKLHTAMCHRLLFYSESYKHKSRGSLANKSDEMLSYAYSSIQEMVFKTSNYPQLCIPNREFCTKYIMDTMQTDKDHALDPVNLDTAYNIELFHIQHTHRNLLLHNEFIAADAVTYLLSIFVIAYCKQHRIMLSTYHSFVKCLLRITWNEWNPKIITHMLSVMYPSAFSHPSIVM